MNIRELINDMNDEILSRKTEILVGAYPDDVLQEIIDGWIPTNDSDILDCLADDNSLAYIDEIGLCTNETNIFKRIQAAIYERLSSAAYVTFEAMTNES